MPLSVTLRINWAWATVIEGVTVPAGLLTITVPARLSTAALPAAMLAVVSVMLKVVVPGLVNRSIRVAWATVAAVVAAMLEAPLPTAVEAAARLAAVSLRL